MLNWRIEYYETFANRSLVFDFVKKLPLETQGRIRNAFRLLEEFGPKIGLPHFLFCMASAKKASKFLNEN